MPDLPAWCHQAVFSECARANASNFAVFSSLNIPKDAVSGFTGPQPNFVPMSSGPLLLYFDVKGQASEPVELVVTDKPDVCRVVSGLPTLTPVLLGERIPTIGVWCGLDDGTSMPQVLVSARARSVVNGSCSGPHHDIAGVVSASTADNGVASFTSITPAYGGNGTG